MPTPPWSFDTLQIHAGAVPDPVTRARVTPVYQTASFSYESVDQAAASFRLEDLDSFAYTRLSNPTTATAERRIAALEGGTAAVATASGQAATTAALLNLVRSGDHIVASSQIYGGTSNLLLQRFPELGIDVTVIHDVQDLEEWRRAVTPRTRAFFAESIGNPLGVVLDISAVARIAHDMARAVRPVHTLRDGDVVFALSTARGVLPAPAPGLHPQHRHADQVNQILTASADVLTRAIVHAIASVEPWQGEAGTVPSYRSLYGQ